MRDRVQPAKGHIAGIVPYDDETVLLPLNATEARRLMHALDAQISKLVQSGDFPEKEEYSRLRDNLMTCNWMFNS